MKRIIQVKLLPTAEQAGASEQTMRRFNAACNWVAERAFERQLANSYALHKLYYYEVREKFDLPADIAILTFAQVAANYKRDKSKRVLFRPLAADLAKNHRRRKRIRKKLKRIGDREARFRRNTNHCISKRLVAKAKDTAGGIALEDLKGIRSRIRFRKPQRARIAGWGFDQLRRFIAYKAQQAGVKLMLVDPKHTSQMCSQCEHIERANRSSRSKFRCKQCGYQAHADYNAARNIRARALVNAPIVSAYFAAAG